METRRGPDRLLSPPPPRSPRPFPPLKTGSQGSEGSPHTAESIGLPCRPRRRPGQPRSRTRDRLGVTALPHPA